ncbi:ABC-type branched-subunit amino acid transport system substrate-binding protein [Bradyrhizobium sp. GM24.11]
MIVFAIAGDCANGTLFAFMPDSTTNAAVAAAVAKLKGSSLSAAGCTLYAYAAVQAWAGSVKQTGAFDATRVAAALLGLNRNGHCHGSIRLQGR